MIARDAAFHSAIRAGNEQCVLIRMPDTSTFLTNEDIAEGGLSFTESVNPETNLTMGRAVQSEISLELLNDGLLQNVGFDGEIDVRLGVKTDDRVEDVSVPAGAMLMCVSEDGNVIAAHSNWDHLVIDGENYDLPDGLRAYLLTMVGDELYVIGKDGAMIARYSVTANAVNELPTFSLSAFMRSKLARLAEKCVCHRISEYERFDYRVRNGRLYAIEWQTCPLGKFVTSKPDKVRSSVISLSAYDGMSKFEIEAMPFFDTLTFPITMWDMLTALCAYCGVEMGAVSLINGDKTFDEVPVFDDGLTCREVLAWIAEANCTFARVNRYGNLDMHWYEDEDYVLMRDDIYDLIEAEYTVKQIEKLQVHCTEEDIGVIIPANDATKKNYYEIMDNPMLYGTRDADIRPWAQPIYERLIAFERYCPTYIEAESDWTVQAGDIISFEQEDGSSKRFPMMNQTITWKGGTAKTVMDCTGEKTRGQMTSKQRERLANGRTIHEFKVTLEEFKSTIENMDVDTVATYAQPEAPPSANEGDLWVDTNDNNRMYRYDGSKWVDCTNSSVTVKTYAQGTAPSGANAGDLWINTADSNKLYRYNGSSWVAYASEAGIDTYAQTSAPASGVKVGDLWIDTDDNNAMYRWSGSAWVKVRDTHLDSIVESHSTWITQNQEKIDLGAAAAASVEQLLEWQKEAKLAIAPDAIVQTVTSSTQYTALAGDVSSAKNQAEAANTAALNAVGIANGKGKVWFQTSAPTGNVNDLWIDTTGGANTPKRWNGSAWVAVTDKTATDAAAAAAAANATANSAIGIAQSAESKVSADSIVSTVRSSKLYLDDLGNLVPKDEVVSYINQTAEEIKIQANRIALEGIITANGNVKIDSAGNITCNNGTFTNGTFTGTLTTGNWKFDSNGSNYTSGSIKVNMTMLTGGGYVGGGSSYRAFYGSSNCDVQYGADYGYNTFIRSKAITIVAHNDGDMSDYRMATFSKYPGPKDYEDFTFYCEESDYDEPAGNLGYAEQPWDTIYVNSCFRLSEKTFSSKYAKHDIEELPDMGDLLDKLTPVSFKYNYKHVEDQTRYGLILEDAVKVLPAICFVPDYEEGSAEYLSEAAISYSDLIAPMLKEIQSLRRRVAALEQ